MKIAILASSALAWVLLTGCAADKIGPAKISKADAETIALTKAPNGIIKEAELEREHGKLIWSFDIATPDSKNITEVNVDAMTGDVIAVEQETPEQQSREKD